MAKVFHQEGSYIYVDELSINRNDLDSSRATATASDLSIPEGTPVSGIGAINLDEIEKDNDNLGIRIKFFDLKQ